MVTPMSPGQQQGSAMTSQVESALARSLQGVCCARCGLSSVCLPPAISAAELGRFNSLVIRPRPLHRGSLLFYEGQLFDSLYVVRSGAVKTSITLPSGLEQITNFYLPGEVIGLDSIGLPAHCSTATALQTTAVCAIPVRRLHELARHMPPLQQHIFRLMGAEIRGNHELILAVAQRSAEERVAVFLLSLSLRLKRCHLSSESFHLPMSRAEFGNYLGLALETISRVISRMQAEGILDVHGKEIHILNPCQLLALANVGAA